MQQAASKLAFILITFSLVAASSLWATKEDEKSHHPPTSFSFPPQHDPRHEQWKKEIARNPAAMSLFREEAARGNPRAINLLRTIPLEDTASPPDILLLVRDASGYRSATRDEFLNAAQAAGAQACPPSQEKRPK